MNHDQHAAYSLCVAFELTPSIIVSRMPSSIKLEAESGGVKQSHNVLREQW